MSGYYACIICVTESVMSNHLIKSDMSDHLIVLQTLALQGLLPLCQTISCANILDYILTAGFLCCVQTDGVKADTEIN